MGITNLIKEYSNDQEAKDFIRLTEYTNDSIFLTGKAGTGKSYLLKKFVEHTKKKFVILAPTGVAALNVGGQTIHSFFQFPIIPLLPNDANIRIIWAQRKMFENLDVIIIDEISMVRCDIMNAIDVSLRRNLGSNLPFAGKQIIMIGDIYQLPPVIDNNQTTRDILNNNYDSKYFFGQTNDDFSFHYIELKKVYRQSDEDFITLLDKVRKNEITDIDLNSLNTRVVFSADLNNDTIFLCTTNKNAANINNIKLNQIPNPSQKYTALVIGSFTHFKEDNLPTSKELNLKVDAKIILIKNDPRKQWVNGDLGIIKQINQDSVVILLDRNKEQYNVGRYRWEDYRYKWNQETNRIEKEIIGTFEQLPIKLAWAVTIHKSQGLTFDRIAIDIGNGAFDSGQVYVALSRCTSFRGINLVNHLSLNDIQADKEIVDFLEQLNGESMEREEFEIIISGLEKKLDFLEKENSDQKQKINEIEKDNSNLASEFNRIKKQNSTKENVIKVLILLLITLIILLLI